MKTLYTIGYSGKNAQKFFESLKNHNIKRLIDVRLYNTSQLAGYTKSSDLAYFLEQICGISYTHALCLAPTASLLDKFKNSIFHGRCMNPCIWIYSVNEILYLNSSTRIWITPALCAVRNTTLAVTGHWQQNTFRQKAWWTV